MSDKKMARVWSRLGNRTKGVPHTYYSQVVSEERPSKKYRPVPLPQEIGDYRVYLHTSAVNEVLASLDIDSTEENISRQLSSGKEVQVLGYYWAGTPDANLKVQLVGGRVTHIIFSHLIWKRKPRCKLLRSYRVK